MRTRVDICPSCDGTGEGQFDGSSCQRCQGTGFIEPSEKYEAFDIPDEPEYPDNYQGDY